MNKSNKIQFLECYEKHPCLWNPQEANYRNNSVRLAALRSIIQEMQLNISVEELKMKIKNIRTTYNREAGKVENSKKNGASKADVYKPQLLWFKTADRFLKAVIVGRNKDNSIKESEDSVGNTNSDASSYLDESNSEPVEKKKKFLFPKKRAERVQKIEPPVLETVERFKTSSIQNTHPDEFDTFGQHVANQLRSLPLGNAIMCQNFINNYLTQERLAALNTRSMSSPSDYLVEADPE